MQRQLKSVEGNQDNQSPSALVQNFYTALTKMLHRHQSNSFHLNHQILFLFLPFQTKHQALHPQRQ